MKIGVRVGTVLQPHLFLQSMNYWTDNMPFSHLYSADFRKLISMISIIKFYGNVGHNGPQ